MKTPHLRVKSMMVRFVGKANQVCGGIRDSLDKERTVASGISVYTALTEIASDTQSEIFTTTEAWVAMKAGLSAKTASARLTDLVEIDLLKISTPKLKAPSTFHTFIRSATITER